MCLSKSFNSVIKIFVVMCLLTAMILVVVFRNKLAMQAQYLNAYVDLHPYKEGPALLLGLYILCELLFIPAGLVTTGIGYILGQAYKSNS